MSYSKAGARIARTSLIDQRSRQTQPLVVPRTALATPRVGATVSPIDLDGLRRRIAEIKAAIQGRDSEGRVNPSSLPAAIQSTLAVVSIVYGAESHQVRTFLAWSRTGGGIHDLRGGVFEARIALGLPGILDAALADHEAGLTTSLRILATGEVLGDFVGLARAALDTGSPESERVGAVLAAASLEETLKKLGELNGSTCMIATTGV
jgi:hypothetical protein